MFTTNYAVPKHFKTEAQKRRESESRWKIAGRFILYVGVAPLALGLLFAFAAMIANVLGLGR